MKITVEKSDLTLDVLVDLFSTALYHNPAWTCDYDSIEYHTKCDVNERDCYEDKIAKLLLAGCSVEMCDRYVEDENDRYGDNAKAFWDEEYEFMVYPITLDDIISGLEKAAMEGYHHHVFSLLKDDNDFDMIVADTLMQFIVFKEVIYG